MGDVVRVTTGALEEGVAIEVLFGYADGYVGCMPTRGMEVDVEMELPS